MNRGLCRAGHYQSAGEFRAIIAFAVRRFIKALRGKHRKRNHDRL